MPTANYLPVEIQNISMWKRLSFLVLLRHGEEDRVLPINIGPPEAHAIAAGLNRQSTPRPLTHDLAHNILLELGARLQKVHVTDLRDGTYYAILFVEHAGRVLEIDSRPSDAFALAVRFGAPIFVREDILREHAVNLERSSGVEDVEGAEERTESEEEEPADPLTALKRRLDKAIAEERYEEAARLRDELGKLEGGN